MSERMQIRCCCNPNVVLGTVPIGRKIPERRLVPLRVVGIGGVGWIRLETFRFSGEERKSDGTVIDRIDSIALKSNDLPAYVAVYIEGFEPLVSEGVFDEQSIEILRELMIRERWFDATAKRDQESKAIEWLREHAKIIEFYPTYKT